jgi:hypothetical protein
MIAAQLKSNYSKHELFDYFIPLETNIFTNSHPFAGVRKVPEAAA